jgi:hypothetical protein
MTIDSHAHDGHGTPPKTVLFCPNCDHRSPIAGDWHVLTTDDGRHVFCPECGRIVTTRPPVSAGASVPSVRNPS